MREHDCAILRASRDQEIFKKRESKFDKKQKKKRELRMKYGVMTHIDREAETIP